MTIHRQLEENIYGIIQEDELKGTICEFMENYDLNSLEGRNMTST